MKTTLAAGAAAVFAPAEFGHAAETKLSWKHFPAGPNGFFRAPVLLSGPTEALLIDGGFSFSDGRAVADAIKATGKKLTAIYISQSDPDYYFSLKPLRDAFPNVKVIAAAATVEAIKGSVEKKLAVWGPKLKENGPQTLSDVVLPEAFDGSSLTVDGETIEIVAAEGLPNRRYLWVPSLKAVFGGVMIFSGVHVWTADTQAAALRAAWIANLDRIAARKPAVVVAGHTTARSGDRSFGHCAHQGLSRRVRGRTGQGQGQRRIEGGDGSPLPQSRHGRRPRHRLQGRQRRNEVGLRRAPVLI